MPRPKSPKTIKSVVSAAIEGSGMGGMKLPIGMTRRALSYDDNLEAPMSTPPHDININNLWRRPVIPARKFSQLTEVCLLYCFFQTCFVMAHVQPWRDAVCRGWGRSVFLHQEDENGAIRQSTVQDSAPSKSGAVVKTKASSIIMNSLITSTLHLLILIISF